MEKIIKKSAGKGKHRHRWFEVKLSLEEARVAMQVMQENGYGITALWHNYSIKPLEFIGKGESHRDREYNPRVLQHIETVTGIPRPNLTSVISMCERDPHAWTLGTDAQIGFLARDLDPTLVIRSHIYEIVTGWSEGKPVMTLRSACGENYRDPPFILTSDSAEIIQRVEEETAEHKIFLLPKLAGPCYNREIHALRASIPYQTALDTVELARRLGLECEVTNKNVPTFFSGPNNRSLPPRFREMLSQINSGLEKESPCEMDYDLGFREWRKFILGNQSPRLAITRNLADICFNLKGYNCQEHFSENDENTVARLRGLKTQSRNQKVKDTYVLEVLRPEEVSGDVEAGTRLDRLNQTNKKRIKFLEEAKGILKWGTSGKGVKFGRTMLHVELKPSYRYSRELDREMLPGMGEKTEDPAKLTNPRDKYRVYGDNCMLAECYKDIASILQRWKSKKDLTDKDREIYYAAKETIYFIKGRHDSNPRIERKFRSALKEGEEYW